MLNQICHFFEKNFLFSSRTINWVNLSVASRACRVVSDSWGSTTESDVIGEVKVSSSRVGVFSGDIDD